MSWRSLSYDELPALSVRGPELRLSLRTVTMAWMYGVVWLTCVSSAHVTVFGKAIGFNEFHFGLMSAIPFLATLSQLFAAILIERTGLRKYQFMHCAVAHRLMWIPIALVPLIMPLPSQAAVAAVLVLLAVSWFLESLARPAWMTWMGDLVPRRIRGRYFARRARMAQAVMVATVILLGLVMDSNWKLWKTASAYVHLPFITDYSGQPLVSDLVPAGFTETTSQRDRADKLRCFRHEGSGWIVAIKDADCPRPYPSQSMLLGEMQEGRLLLYTICGVFFVAALFGAQDILLFRRVREVMPPVHHMPPPHPRISLPRQLHDMLWEPLKNRVFRNYVLYASSITFTQCMGGMYFWIFAMRNLGFSQLAANLLFMVVGPLADMAAAPAWGRLIDRWGRKPILLVSTIGTLTSILPWFFMTTSTPCPRFISGAVNYVGQFVSSAFGYGGGQWIGPDTPAGAYLLAIMGCIVGGVSWSGFNLAQLGVMMSFSDGTGRSKSVAVSGVLISAGGILGGAVGGLVTYLLQSMPAIGPFLWCNLHVAFFGSLIVRLGSIGFLLGMPDPGAKPVRALLAHVRINMYNAVQSRALYPLRIFGWGRETQRHD